VFNKNKNKQISKNKNKQSNGVLVAVSFSVWGHQLFFFFFTSLFIYFIKYSEGHDPFWHVNSIATTGKRGGQTTCLIG
jgi:hypothetical protein